MAEDSDQLLGHLSLHRTDPSRAPWGGAAIAFCERRGGGGSGRPELTLSGEPWTLPLVLFVSP